MALIILLPALACWVVLATGSVRKALLNVYLPSILLLPQYYTLRLPHLPILTFGDAAILPIGLALIATEMRRWRLAWMDLWVLLFAACIGLAQGLSTELANGEWTRVFSAESATSSRLSTNLADGALMFIAAIMSMVLPYMAGKLLIEQPDREEQTMRRKLVGRMASLLAVVATISVYDFVTGGSIWQKVGAHVFPNQYVGWPPQMRWGFGRIAGPYGHAILAGMIFLMGLIYCLWLRRVDPSWGTRRVVSGLPLTQRGLTLCAVVAGLLMTQSRGPWLGVLLALLFALLTRYLSVPKAAVAFLVLVAVFSAVTYHFGKAYTAKDLAQATNEEQQSAIYRRQLLSNYAPLVKQRMAFGWGITTFPSVMGKKSIDNEYLLLAVTEGFAGLGLFLAIAAGSAKRLLSLIAHPEQPEDRLLVFAHLAVLIGLMTSLATVYMGEQVVMLFLLFTGWVQGMRPAWASAGVENAVMPQYGFRRVLV
jgi:O-antigen ligase